MRAPGWVRLGLGQRTLTLILSLSLTLTLNSNPNPNPHPHPHQVRARGSSSRRWSTAAPVVAHRSSASSRRSCARSRRGSARSRRRWASASSTCARPPANPNPYPNPNPDPNPYSNPNADPNPNSNLNLLPDAHAARSGLAGGLWPGRRRSRAGRSRGRRRASAPARHAPDCARGVAEAVHSQSAEAPPSQDLVKAQAARPQPPRRRDAAAPRHARPERDSNPFD